MFTSLALGKLAKWALSKLTLRNIFYFLMTIAIAYGVYQGYNWIIDRGAAQQAAIDKPIIDKANNERTAAVNKLAEYKTAYNNFVDTSKKANEALIAANAARLQDLRQQLANAQTSANHKKDVSHDIAKYITPTADAACILPISFVRVFNYSLEGQAATGGSSDVFSVRNQGDDATPSGIALSQFTGLAVENNAEAVQRGVIIRQWQTWYNGAKKDFTTAQQLKADAIQRIPEEGKPDAGSTAH